MSASKTAAGDTEDERKARLAAELKANLRRRKAQARSRQEPGAGAQPHAENPETSSASSDDGPRS